MARVTGLSLVDNQYVFVRGLGERYSNTTLAGLRAADDRTGQEGGAARSVPDRPHRQRAGQQVVLARSVGGVRRRAGADRADEASEPARARLLLRSRSLLNATGKSIPLSPLGSRDVWGFDNGARALPSSFPATKSSARASSRLTSAPRNESPSSAARSRTSGARNRRWQPGQNWSATLGNRFGKLGVVASVTHSYKEHTSKKTEGSTASRAPGTLEDTQRLRHADRHSESPARNRRQPRPTSSLRTTGSPSRTSTRTAAGTRGASSRARTSTTAREYQNYRLQFIEEGLIANAVGGEHFLQKSGTAASTGG